MMHLVRFLVTLNFCFPFINGEGLLGMPFELNIFPLLLAVMIKPAVCLYGAREMALLALAAIACLFFADLDRATRLVFNLLPFILCMSYVRYCVKQGVPVLFGSLVVASYVLFTVLCVYQTLHNHGVVAMPATLVNFLTEAIPRYMSSSYDENGLRGVQGWASEPSGAALLSLAFYLYLRAEYPGKWKVLAAIFVFNIILNKSVYAFITLIFMAIFHLVTSSSAQQKVLGSIVAVFGLAITASIVPRVDEVFQALSTHGWSWTTNEELARFIQIIQPIRAFPMYYETETHFHVAMHPLGLLASGLGYGSVLGMLVLISIGLSLRRHFADVKPYDWIRMNGAPMFFIFILAPANFVPVALCAAAIARFNHAIQSPKKLKKPAVYFSLARRY